MKHISIKNNNQKPKNKDKIILYPGKPVPYIDVCPTCSLPISSFPGKYVCYKCNYEIGFCLNSNALLYFDCYKYIIHIENMSPNRWSVMDDRYICSVPSKPIELSYWGMNDFNNYLLMAIKNELGIKFIPMQLMSRFRKAWNIIWQKLDR